MRGPFQFVNVNNIFGERLDHECLPRVVLVPFNVQLLNLYESSSVCISSKKGETRGIVARIIETNDR